MRTIENYSTDWAAIKAAWIVGTPSIRALAKAHGLSDTAIRRRAKQENWPVRGLADGSQREPECEREQTAKPEPAPVSAAVAAVADADPKALARAGRLILQKLSAELDLYSSSLEVLEQIIEQETRGDRSAKRRQLLLRIISLPTRIQAARNLASSLSLLQDAGPGKKALANDEAADAVAEDDDWGSDLNPGARQARVN